MDILFSVSQHKFSLLSCRSETGTHQDWFIIYTQQLATIFMYTMADAACNPCQLWLLSHKAKFAKMLL